LYTAFQFSLLLFQLSNLFLFPSQVVFGQRCDGFWLLFGFVHVVILTHIVATRSVQLTKLCLLLGETALVVVYR